MELHARFSLPDSLRHGPGLYGTVCRGIVRLSQRHPRTSLALTVAAAGVGYAFILLFPYLVVTTPETVYPALAAARTPQQWLIAAAQVCTLFVAGVFTYTLLTLRFDPPPGRTLTEREAPALFALLAQLRESYGRPGIGRVVLDEGDDVRVVKTPRTAFPLLNTTTLVIGLPLLHTVSPQHLRVLLARRIGQLSGRHDPLTSMLVHLKSVWRQYRDLRHGGSLPARLIGRFFAVYAPVYDLLALGISRREEMNADRDALDFIDDQAIVEAISYHAVSRDFLASRYWPTIKRMAARARGAPDYLPYEHMTTVMRKGLTAPALGSVMQRLFNEDDFCSPVPTLGDRLENLGCSGPIPLREPASAAAELFPQAFLAAIVKAFHDRWLEAFASSPEAP